MMWSDDVNIKGPRGWLHLLSPMAMTYVAGEGVEQRGVMVVTKRTRMKITDTSGMQQPTYHVWCGVLCGHVVSSDAMVVQCRLVSSYAKCVVWCGVVWCLVSSRLVSSRLALSRSVSSQATQRCYAHRTTLGVRRDDMRYHQCCETR